MTRIASLLASPIAVLAVASLFASGCAAAPAEEPASSGADLSSGQADRGCRVFFMSGGIVAHASVDGDFNPVSAVVGRQDASGRFWWPFAADVGLGAWVPAGVTVGVTYSVDGRDWKTVEATQPTFQMMGTRVFHFEWGDGVLPFASGSLLMCQPGSLASCLSQQRDLRPLAVEAFVRMPDGTTYYDHNTANADTVLAGDMSSLHLDGSNGWQAPSRDLLHCEMPGT
jgi:hypothetical protein